jgi:hypothetical protein
MKKIPCETCILLASCKIKGSFRSEGRNTTYYILYCELLFDFFEELPRDGDEREKMFVKISELLETKGDSTWEEQ